VQTNLISQLKTGGLAVIPTDTIFGIVCSALDKRAVEKVYGLKKRSPTKPVIILIARIKDLELFSVQPSTVQKQALAQYWPGKVSIVLPCKNKAFKYLHRGTNTLAFRLPKKQSLLTLLKKTGPLIAPSANPEGLPPAKNLKEAKVYFGDSVTYLGGKTSKKASKIIKLSENGEVTILRA
jgi:L-threonylcarbamoyladenylate synthase